ncbi:MAG: hypothetical protein QOG85_848 [Gaiellaceae bacterium]|nr:hypothetical protein [Gaiellaceae bacterium]
MEPIYTCRRCAGDRVIACPTCKGERLEAGPLGPRPCRSCRCEGRIACPGCNGTGLRTFAPVEKRCRCGARYDAAGWLALPYLGVQQLDAGEPRLELRNCTCGSTLAIELREVA